MRRARGPAAALRSVLERSLHEQARALWSWVLGLAALGLALTALYPTIRGNPVLGKLQESYPKAVQSLFGISDVTTGAGYLRAEIFSLTAPMLLVIFAVLWGSDLVAGEEDRGTLELLLANPVSRRRVVVEKSAALAAGVGLVCTGLVAGLAIGLPAFGLEVGWAKVAAAVVATGLLGLLFGSLALALGAATGRRGLARGLTALLAVGAYLASTLAALVSWLGPLRDASPWYHALGVDPLVTGFAPWHLLLLAGLTLVVTAGAVGAFERRDLGV